MKITSEWQGLMEYEGAYQRQLHKIEMLRNTNEKEVAGCVLGLEHPSVITLGVRGQKNRDVSSKLPAEVSVIETNRGGEATFHCPGQLVIYPILDLKKLKLGAKDYVCLLTKVTQQFLHSYNIESHTGEEPGLFTQKGKIVAVGIKISQGISSHGIAINVCNEIELAQSIRVCGVERQSIDKMFVSKVDLEPVFFRWMETFLKSI